MARPKTKKHIHKYEFSAMSQGGPKLYHCSDEDGCTHHMPNHMLPKFLQSRCWNCGGQFGINTSQNKERYPICELCIGGQKITCRSKKHPVGKEQLAARTDAIMNPTRGEPLSEMSVEDAAKKFAIDDESNANNEDDLSDLIDGYKDFVKMKEGK